MRIICVLYLCTTLRNCGERVYREDKGDIQRRKEGREERKGGEMIVRYREKSILE